MNPLEDENVNLDGLLSYYYDRAEKDLTNIKRVKKLYTDEDSFNGLMNRIIAKDFERFERLRDKDICPNPWRVFYIILEIVLDEGEVVPPYDVLTNMFPSKSVKYMGWTFSWVHGESTLISVFNRRDELVYRF